MGANIEAAVQLALGGFLKLASRSRESDPSTPLGPTLEGAYALGRGEARSGRRMDALLAAYRVGARVAWRELSRAAGEAGLDAVTMAHFAELIFAYIDELSAASVAGHTDELSTTGRVQERYRERLGQQLLAGAGAGRARAPRRAGGLAAAAHPHRGAAARGPGARGACRCWGKRPSRSARTCPARRRASSSRCCWCPTWRAGTVSTCCGSCTAAARWSARPARGRGADVVPAGLRRRGATCGLRPAGDGTGRWTPSSTSPSWWSVPTRRRSTTCAPGCSPRSPSSSRRRPSGWPRRCGPGCCTWAVGTPSRRTCTCTRRRSATGWASCASCTATGSTTRTRCSSSCWRCTVPTVKLGTTPT